MAFFLWIAGSAAGRLEGIRAMEDSLPDIQSIVAFASIAAAFASYFLATFLIRGFRAPVEFLAADDGASSGGGSPGYYPVPEARETAGVPRP